jgi:hypothetical protein
MQVRGLVVSVLDSVGVSLEESSWRGSDIALRSIVKLEELQDVRRTRRGRRAFYRDGRR